MHEGPVHVIENVGDGHAVACGDRAGIGEMLSAAAAVAAEGFERLMQNRIRLIYYDDVCNNTNNNNNIAGALLHLMHVG